MRAHRPDLLVLHDVCLYWEPGHYNRFRAADLAVIAGPRPPRPPHVYLAWQDPPLLFVGEVVSDLTRGEETGEKKTDYEQHLQVPEYLIGDPSEGMLQLFRLAEGGYQPVHPDENG